MCWEFTCKAPVFWVSRTLAVFAEVGSSFSSLVPEMVVGESYDSTPAKDMGRNDKELWIVSYIIRKFRKKDTLFCWALTLKDMPEVGYRKQAVWAENKAKGTA